MFWNDSDLLRPMKSDFENTFSALTQKKKYNFKAETPYLDL